jgi:hypothetical protein
MELIQIIIFGLIVWFIATFFWTRVIFIFLLMLVWCGGLIAGTFVGLRTLFSEPFGWFYLYAIPALGFGLFIMWALYGIAAKSGIDWLKNNSLRKPWNAR